MIDCKTIAAEHKERLKRFIRENKIEVSLAVIQVGCDPASSSYIRGKSKDCDEVGIKFNHYHLPETVDTESVLSLIHTLNDDASVSGIIVQLPLPKQLDKAAIINAVSDKKDVDGFKSSSEFTPCTPLGILLVLDSLGVSVDGWVCCVIGRGEVGKPMVDLLTKFNATVIWCNSHTKAVDLKRLQDVSDIVVSATGVPGLVPHPYNNQIILDVGISKGADGKLYGDVSKSCYCSEANITPVPGGVGLMTRVALLENTVSAVAPKWREWHDD